MRKLAARSSISTNVGFFLLRCDWQGMTEKRKKGKAVGTE
jgi:hypothetical protein